ncbi:MAG: nucleotidyltransferase family protein [Candidatus Brocadiae bacterium]|nr:nucleotidyltransferase family protein [Candidatus Brocadiia bacterium]
MNSRLVPVVLAAGASSRMGRPKPLLDLRGRTALDRILDVCALAGVAPAVVVLGSDAEAVEAGCDLGRAIVARHGEWARGMTSSLQAGLRVLPAFAEGVFVWPVDLPLVPAQVVRELAIRFALARQNQRLPILIPRGSRRGHPVLFDRGYLADLLALPSDRPPRDVIDRHAGAVEEVRAGEEVVRDLDTPADYAAALEADPR